MTLEIISAHEVTFKGDAVSVTLPGMMGSFTVLKNHAPLISVLVKGNVKNTTPDGNEKSLGIERAIADVNNNVVSVCVY